MNQAKITEKEFRVHETGVKMILYEPDTSIRDYGIQGRLFSKYIRIIQDKDFFKVLQIRKDEYTKEVQKRYERRYNIVNKTLRKLKQWLQQEVA